jgi:hypothetical protein
MEFSNVITHMCFRILFCLCPYTLTAQKTVSKIQNKTVDFVFVARRNKIGVRQRFVQIWAIFSGALIAKATSNDVN